MGIDLLLPTTRFDRPREVRRRHHHQGTKKDTLSGVHTLVFKWFPIYKYNLYIYREETNTIWVGTGRKYTPVPYPRTRLKSLFFFN